MFINEEIKWAAKYPFDTKAKKLLELIAFDIKEYTQEDLKFLLEKAYRRVYNALDHKYSLAWENNYQEVIIFYLSALIVRGTDNEYLYRVFSDSESKRAYRLLREDNIKNLLQISQNLGLNIKGRGEEILLSFIDFITFNRYLSATHWKLYNFEMEKGFVILKKRQLARLCSQKIKETIYDMIREVSEIPLFIRDYSDRLKQEKTEMFSKIQEVDFVDIKEDMFPPCIKRIINNIGLGLSHPARFILVTFLHRIGYSIEDIVNLFRKVPDFNEKMTRYQVEHILGMKGSRIEYSVPSCKKIKSYGLCTPDENCKYIKHPLQYVERFSSKIRGERGKK